MTLVLEPEIGVPFSPDMSYMDLRVRAEAACATISELCEHGLEVDPSQEDRDVAAALVTSYAEDAEKTSKKVTNRRAAALTPASLVLTGNIIKEFGQAVVESSLHIRHMVTNKLILETENPDPRVRIRALELLGKISDVGLFAEKAEVTVTHQTTDDLREKLRIKLMKLVNPEEEAEDAEIIDVDVVDVDQELGVSEETDE
jgi:hypothetical protein